MKKSKISFNEASDETKVGNMLCFKAYITSLIIFQYSEPEISTILSHLKGQNALF